MKPNKNMKLVKFPLFYVTCLFYSPNYLFKKVIWKKKNVDSYHTNDTVLYGNPKKILIPERIWMRIRRELNPTFLWWQNICYSGPSIKTIFSISAIHLVTKRGNSHVAPSHSFDPPYLGKFFFFNVFRNSNFSMNVSTESTVRNF